MGRLQITHDPFRYDSLPPELTTDSRRWYLWRYELRDGEDKPTKVPYQCLNSLLRASSTNEQHWSKFPFALATLERKHNHYDGLGRVFAPSDGICGIDLDDVWQSDSNDLMKPWVGKILARFGDTYSEVSPSGNGYKLWFYGTLPAHQGRKWEVDGSKVEMYDAARFFTVTGWTTGPRRLSDHQDDLNLLLRSLSYYHSSSHSNSDNSTDPIPTGRRHKTLVRLAGLMHVGGASDEAIRFALGDMNTNRCCNYYSTSHIDQIIRSRSNWR